MIREFVYKCPTSSHYEISDFDRWWLRSALKGWVIIGVRVSNGDIILKITDQLLSPDAAFFLALFHDFIEGRATGGNLD